MPPTPNHCRLHLINPNKPWQNTRTSSHLKVSLCLSFIRFMTVCPASNQWNCFIRSRKLEVCSVLVPYWWQLHFVLSFWNMSVFYNHAHALSPLARLSLGTAWDINNCTGCCFDISPRSQEIKNVKPFVILMAAISQNLSQALAIYISVKENSVSIHFTLIFFVLHSL